MTLIELQSPSPLADFVRSKNAVVVTFSAHWCGPCRASKPALQSLATKMSDKIPMGIVYEDTLGDATHSVYHIRAFPTHVLFVNGVESQRIEGANIPAIETMIQTYLATAPTVSNLASMTGGETLGGSSDGPVLSPAEARLARLAKLGMTTSTTTTTAPTTTTTADVSMTEVDSDVKISATTTDDGHDNDVDMVDKVHDNDDADEPQPPPVMIDPTLKLNPEHIQTLTETMGFALIRAQKGLLYGNGNTAEGAIEWLMEHQDDSNIDDPIPLQDSNNEGGQVAQSYKCNECGKILSNMANLELHANKTGHSDFEESTQCIKPLTPEEKIAKIAEIKQLLKLKRTEREEAEKVDDLAREIQRRQMGKEMAKTKEQLDAEQRKRDAMLRKKEKADFARERERLREELARDKAERASGKGKLSSRLGVDGYKPDGIQYDVSTGGTDIPHATDSAEPNTAVGGSAPKAKKKGDPTKIDEYIKKVSSYRAGGDGGNCLRILLLYVGNVVDNPTEEKYKTIKMDNKTYRMKVKPFIGAKDLLLACGFAPPEGGSADMLVLPNEHMDLHLLTETKAKLEAAYEAFNK